MKLSQAIEAYVQRRRREGILFVDGSKTLNTFCDQISDLALDEVSTQHIFAFLNSGKPKHGQLAINSWRVKHSLLRKFFEYWAARDVVRPLLMPPNMRRVQNSFVAHIYTREEVRRLVRAIPKCQSDLSCLLDEQTVRCAILLLYATGARIGEIVGLRTCDVDAKGGYISILGGRFGRSRKIPVGRDLRLILSSYLSLRQQKQPTNDRLFVTRDGRPASARKFQNRFQRLRVIAGIQSKGGKGKPRMNDLRASFAVHRIASWIKSEADLNRMLPALAAYMGLVGLTATERYLAITPERFRKELNKLSPQRSKRHWRDDPKLMKFLASL